jgi:hypothetical protein
MHDFELWRVRLIGMGWKDATVRERPRNDSELTDSRVGVGDARLIIHRKIECIQMYRGYIITYEDTQRKETRPRKGIGY